MYRNKNPRKKEGEKKERIEKREEITKENATLLLLSRLQH